MICRHGPNDPDCGSNRRYYSEPIPSPRPEWNAATTPDASNYTIETAERVQEHLVLKVKYPNCSSCAFEGTKIMVFLNVSEQDVIRWKRINPHFRDPKIRSAIEAPSPSARFPGTPAGWADAITYARGKINSRT